MNKRTGLTTEAQIEEMRHELYDLKKIPIKLRFVYLLRYGFSVSCIVACIMLFGSIYRMKQMGQIPNVFGYYLFSIESGSMSPTLEIGDIIVSKKPATTDDLEVGTIVTYYNTDNGIVTHRITEKLTDECGAVFYKTKGDYKLNSTDLELLSKDRIISVYCFTLKHA